jgi:hypothetical protein
MSIGNEPLMVIEALQIAEYMTISNDVVPRMMLMGEA